MTIIITLSAGFSLKKWQNFGLLSRELDYIFHLGSNLYQDIIILSYGNQVEEANILYEYKSHSLLINNVAVKCIATVRLCKYDDIINSFFAPFFVDIKPDGQKISFIRSNQFTGSWTAWL